MDTMKITPEVEMTENKIYLVRINEYDEEGKQEAAFVDSLENVKLVIDSIAASEEKRLRVNNTEVFRQDLDNGKRVVISTRGKWLGGMHPKTEIDFIEVGEAVLIRGRHEKIAEIPPPQTPTEDYEKRVMTTIKSWGSPKINLSEQDTSEEVSIDE